MRRTAESRDSGFTLIELMVTMTLFGILIAISVAPYRNYQHAQGHLNSTRNLVGVMRNLQVRAVAENNTYRVTFHPNGKSWTSERKSGTAWVQVGTGGPSETTVRYRDVDFLQTDGSMSNTAYFYPRGSASKGSLRVERSGRSKVYTVTLEGLTARVSYV